MANMMKGLTLTLGFSFLPDDGSGVVRGEFMVTEALAQPFGHCSGGTMLAMEETIAGIGSVRVAGEDVVPLGIQVSANHVKAVPVGKKIRAEARALQAGYKTHVWDVKLLNEADELVSTARVINVIKRPKV